MQFRTTVVQEKKTATGIEVPASVVEGLGAGKRPPVRVTLNGYTYRSTIASMRGVFMLPISAEVRGHSGVAAGDEVDVTVELDTEPREVTVPPDLTAALDAAPEAKTFFEGLSYSNKRRLVLNIEGAKTDETRQRRIAKITGDLAVGKA